MLRVGIMGSPKPLDRGHGRGPKVILIMAIKDFQQSELLCASVLLYITMTWCKHFLSQGVLQSWVAGTPRGDAR